MAPWFEAVDLAASLRQKLPRIERQPLHASLLRHHQSDDAERAFAIEFPLRGEGVQFFVEMIPPVLRRLLLCVRRGEDRFVAGLPDPP